MATKKEEQFRRLQEAMQDHKRKLETDPEYRKRAEASKAAFEEAFHLKKYTRQED